MFHLKTLSFLSQSRQKLIMCNIKLQHDLISLKLWYTYTLVSHDWFKLFFSTISLLLSQSLSNFESGFIWHELPHLDVIFFRRVWIHNLCNLIPLESFYYFFPEIGFSSFTSEFWKETYHDNRFLIFPFILQTNQPIPVYMIATCITASVLKVTWYTMLLHGGRMGK